MASFPVVEGDFFQKLAATAGNILNQGVPFGSSPVTAFAVPETVRACS